MNEHTQEQGLRVHHLVNLGGVIGGAGRDRGPGGFFCGARGSAGRGGARAAPGRGARGALRGGGRVGRGLRRAKAASAPRRQPRTSLGGGGARRRVALVRSYGRRSVVKASFRRNRGKGGWVRHARYLARERAQREAERGVGFDASRD